MTTKLLLPAFACLIGMAALAWAAPEPSLDVLKGQWVRTDGGYRITIKSVGQDGQIEGYYANPMGLPFSQATAKVEDGTVKVFLELTAGGYDGSTYTLVHDPEADVLRGVYFQAVSKESFDVVFRHQKPEAPLHSGREDPAQGETGKSPRLIDIVLMET